MSHSSHSGDSTEKICVGYCVDLLDALSELMNFEYEIYETEEYGRMAPDKTWNGTIQELIDTVNY